MTVTTSEFGLKVVANASFWQAQRLSVVPGLYHLFTSRRGGVSPHPYDSWNMGYSVGDERTNVLANRRLLQQLLPGRPGPLVTASQSHTDRAVLVNAHPRTALEADALLTDRMDIPLMLQFADCIPLVGFDPVTRTVAVIHAGWRGTAAAITAKTIATWCKAYGARADSMWVAIGPGIGRCCYHLPGEDVLRLLDTVPRVLATALAVPWPDSDHQAVDLAEINRQQAIAAGVPARQVLNSGICTACNTQLAFSHRRDGSATGRMAALVLLTAGNDTAV